MEMESREAPPAYRTKLQNKLTRYKADLDKLKREMGGASDRAQLLGGGDMAVCCSAATRPEAIAMCAYGRPEPEYPAMPE